MIRFLKGDFLHILSFIVTLIIGVVLLKSYMASQKEQDIRELLCDEFITATENSLSKEKGETVLIAEEHKDTIRKLFMNSINIKNLTNLSEKEGPIEDYAVENDEDYIKIVTDIMSPEIKNKYFLIYNHYKK